MPPGEKYQIPIDSYGELIRRGIIKPITHLFRILGPVCLIPELGCMPRGLKALGHTTQLCHEAYRPSYASQMSNQLNINLYDYVLRY